MNRIILFPLGIFLMACMSLQVLGKAMPVADLVEEYGLGDTNKVTVSAVVLITKLKNVEKPHVIEIDKNDIPLLLAALHKVSFEQGVYHKCLGDYNVSFYSEKGTHILNLGHKTMIQTQKGIYHLGDDFVAIMKKYLPQYYLDKEAK
ncbi:MAG: hypothetical protein WCI77_02400 [Candidatus Omnitrophota bacterium]